MASLSKESNGYRLYFSVNGKRQKIWLGNCSKTRANEWLVRITDLVDAAKNGERPKEGTKKWLDDLSPTDRKKIERFDFVPKRKSETLAKFLDDFVKKHPTTKPNTIRNLNDSTRQLTEYFGRDKNIQDIQSADASDWADYLVKVKGYSPATKSKHIKRAKQFFKDAVLRQMIPENPFRHLKAGGEVNEDRKEYVPIDVFEKVLAQIEDPELSMILVFSRIGGLRIPSEILELKWSDIDFVTKTILVHSPKKEGTGRADRKTPLFQDLIPFLMAFPSDDRHGFVIKRLRSSAKNWRTPVRRAIRKAGLKPWMKTFQNLRASRETELIQAGHPVHDVSTWLGNSPAVASKHYIMSTNEQFAKGAAESPRLSEALGQNLGQQSEVNRRNDEKKLLGECNAFPAFPVIDTCLLSLQEGLVPPRGVRDTAKTSGNTNNSSCHGADFGALPDELQLIFHSWRHLPPAAKASILQIVRDHLSKLV